jgi:hypothetical protein
VAGRRSNPMELERTIRFYRIGYVGQPPDRIVDTESLLHAIEATNAAGDLYVTSGERVALCLPDSFAPGQLRILNVRRTELPQIEEDGLLAPLSLGRNAGLADQIHLFFFANNVVGSEFNFYGPRPTRLADFVRAKSLGQQIYVDRLLRHDVIGRLDDFAEIRMARLKVSRGTADLVAHIDPDLGEALTRTAEFTQAADVEIVVRRQARSRESLALRIRRVFGRLARDPEAEGGLKALQVEGRATDDEDFELVDLLEQQISARRPIRRVDERSRVLDDRAAYRAIGAAYSDLAEEIERAGWAHQAD